jgi:hypothetical protein
MLRAGGYAKIKLVALESAPDAAESSRSQNPEP